MGKKKKEILDREKPKFAAGMTANGYSRGATEALWSAMEPFADYAFNKAHTAAYGLVSYLTAYLKANYPAEYMAALLTSVGDDKDKSALYLAECRRRGIKVLPPDVNDSVGDFASVGADIRFGLAAVKNVGENVVDAIVTARAESGRFLDLADFLHKIPQQACTKRVLESLIKAGAFDSLGYARRALVEVHERAVEEAVERKKSQALGQYDLFEDIFAGLGGSPGDSTAGESAGGGFGFVVREISDWDKTTRLAFEREMLGLYVSDHPLAGIEHLLAREADLSLGALRAEVEALTVAADLAADAGVADAADGGDGEAELLLTRPGRSDPARRRDGDRRWPADRADPEVVPQG